MRSRVAMSMTFTLFVSGCPLPERFLCISIATTSAAGTRNSLMTGGATVINLPGWRWATIMQFALDGSSCSLHTEVSKAHGGSFGVVHSKISVCGSSRSRGCQPKIRPKMTSAHLLSQKALVYSVGPNLAKNIDYRPLRS